MANSIETKTSTSATMRRATLIGRLALYSLTVFMISCLFVLVVSCLWLLFPLSEPLWLLRLHRLLVAVTLSSGFAFFIVLFIIHRLFIPRQDFSFRPLTNAKVHVGLTAYNDELCIGDAVQAFKSCPYVDKVIVVENNSKDNTYQIALESGADRVVTEQIPGYGSCCMRALEESAIGLGDDDVIVLCEGDMTFSADDVKKFLAYLDNCDLVLGTRATQELRAAKTQMDWLINPANQIVAKMIQVRFWGVRLTDVGCTYRAMRVGSYHCLKKHLWVRGNHFSPHMYIELLKLRMRLIEIPVVFQIRAGESKGVGSNKIKAARVAIRMLGLLYNT
ncbi:MAG: glycosyltransferase family 2 protein [Stenomitos rutilans HA7619-LM2]|jgi:glycosyltransferase involved in cell wall biosynthesis|nr:glycosyltransferase family 2 protein [Stenomitos rutilans HA7619-LM2]